MNKKNANGTKFLMFMKRNVYYFVMAACIIAIATMIIVTVVNKNKADNNVTDAPYVSAPDDPAAPVDKPTNPVENIVFAAPAEKVNILNDYVGDALVYNSTLRHYAVHTGIDFGGEEGTNVNCVYGGTVESVGYDKLNGYTVTVRHNSDLTTSYSSLKDTAVNVGDVVNKGTVLGTMGTTASYEYNLGSHVHFTTMMKGETVDPYKYLSLGDK